MGVDFLSLRAVPRISSLRLLSRLLREFLRWQALRNQGRFRAQCSLLPAPLLPQLVSTALPIRLRRIPLRFRVRRGMPRAAMQTRPSPSSLTSRFALEVSAGLAKPRQKELPSKYLYHSVGSALFEVICALPEYGLTRAEERLLQLHAREIVDQLPRPVVVAELGSGTGRKTRLLLEALSRWQSTWYHPIASSPTALRSEERRVGKECRSRWSP